MTNRRNVFGCGINHDECVMECRVNSDYTQKESKQYTETHSSWTYSLLEATHRMHDVKFFTSISFFTCLSMNRLSP